MKTKNIPNPNGAPRKPRPSLHHQVTIEADLRDRIAASVPNIDARGRLSAVIIDALEGRFPALDNTPDTAQSL